MVDVPDPVGHPRELPLHGLRARRGLHRLEIRKNLDVGRPFGMASDAVADLPGEVQAFLVGPLSGAAALQHLDDPEALDVVPEPAVLRHRPVEGLLPGVPEGGVPQVVSQHDGLGQVLVEPDRPRDRPRDLRDLERMGQPRPVVVALGGEEDLGLVHEAAEGL